MQNFLDFLDRNAEWIQKKADSGLDLLSRDTQ
jgi:hypothetical protein